MRCRTLALAIFAIQSCLAQASPLSPDEMREDVRYLRDVWASTDRSLTTSKRAAFDRELARTLNEIDHFSEAEFALAISRAVAVTHNGHSAASIATRLHGLPIGFEWFEDGLFVIRAEPQYSYLLGSRVEKLGALSAEDALLAVAPYISGTDAWVRSQSPDLLRRLEVLHEVGASRNASSATFVFRVPDGSIRRVRMSAASSEDPAPSSDWLGVIPAPKDLRGRWVHVLDAASKVPPYLRNVTTLEREWWDGRRVVYFRSNHIFGTSTNRYEMFGDLLGILQLEILARRPKYAIVDLRLNHGGDFFNTIDFCQALPKLIPQDGRIFVLVGPNTFSAALVTAAMLKGQGKDRVVLVGDTMGDEAEFWSEGPTLKLPHSQIPVSAATKKQNWSEGCADLGECYWANTVFAVQGVNLQPEVHIKLRFAEYSDGEDPVLAAVLAMMQ